VRTRAGADPRSFLGVYLEDLRARHYAPATLEKAARELPRFFRYVQDLSRRQLASIDEAVIVGYARHLAKARTRSGATYSAWSQSSSLSAVKAFFRFLHRRGLVLRDPAAAVPLPKGQRMPRGVPSEGKARRLMNSPDRWTTAGKRDRAILETLYGTGIRISECMRADLGDVDLRDGALLVRNGKGGKDRLVPLSGQALVALDSYLAESRPELARHHADVALFLSRYGRRYSTCGLRLVVKRHAARVGLQLSPHALRHACATHLLEGGADIRHIQKLLGHASINHTAHYARVTPGALRAAVERAHPREEDWRRRRKMNE
jgi:integrase/recombinase XerD